ncbi:MAG: bile acid:sodium symporter, partial [Alphaproteobacteria bacterium]|nr:bile acid:sodium symporter [Alphaproteobacteria bacterium]
MTPQEIGTQIAFPIVLMTVMFGLGLSLTGTDFSRVFRAPRPALVGILGHAVLLPLTAFGVLSLWNFPPLVAGGLVILAACPGGAVSNAIVYAGRGDVALAVTLTAISSVITVFTIPIVVGFGMAHFAGMAAAVRLDFLDTVAQLGAIILIPMFTGMGIRHFFPAFATRAERYFRVLAIILLIGLVAAGGLVATGVELRDLQYAFAAVLMLLAGATAAGYAVCALARLDTVRTMTVVIEIGVQNAATAYLIGGTLLKEPGLILTPGIYAVMMFLAGGFAILVARRAGA